MSLESLPLELKGKIFSKVLPPDRLNLIRSFEGSVRGCRGPDGGPQYNGTDIHVNLAVGVDLRVRNSPASRQSAISIRKRLCDRLIVKKVCLINIKYDEDTISFIREMLHNCSFEKARIEINEIDHFHPSLVPFINDFSEKVFLRGPLSLLPQLQELKPMRRFDIQGGSARTRRGSDERLDDEKLLAIAAAGHARIDVRMSCECDITEQGLRTILMNLASNPPNQLIRFLSMFKVEQFLRLLGFNVITGNVGRRGRQRQEEQSQEKDEFVLIHQDGLSYNKQYVLWYRTAALLIDGNKIWAVSHHDRATEELRVTRRDDMYDDLDYAFRKSDGESTSRHPTKVLWNP